MSPDETADATESRRLLVQAFQALTTRYAVFVLGFIGSVIIARVLEADGRGAYAYVITVSTAVMSLGHLSIETAYVTLWHEDEDLARLSGSGLTLAAVVGGASSLLAGIVLLQLLDVELPVGATSDMLVAALTVVPLWIASLYANAILANDGQVGTINRASWVTATIQTVLLALLAFLGELDIRAIVWIWAASTVFPLAFQLPALQRSPGLRGPTRSSLRRLVKLGIRYHPGSLALSLILRVDILIAGALVSVGTLGIYSLAVTLTELALLAAAATSQVAIQVQVRGPLRSTADFTAAVARANALLATALVAVLVVSGPLAIELVFGPSFAGTTPSVLSLAPGIIALSWQRPLGVYVTRLDRPLKISIAMSMGLVVNIVLNLVLIPAWGVVGAGVASSVVYVSLAVWTAQWFLNESHLTAADLLPRWRDARHLIAHVRRLRSAR